MTILLWSAALFLCGSLMFSYWLGLAARSNLREIGDGNPGALNLWRAAGFAYGIAGIALDFAKGFGPVAFLLASGRVSGYAAAAASLMPVLGHAFSPFLRGRGGKAIATTFGVWCALSFEGALAYAVILAMLLFGSRLVRAKKKASAEADAFQVVLGMLLLFVYALARAFPAPVAVFALANLLLLAFTHRRELRRLAARRSENRKQR
ncbi:acyl-phosphate glycerol 3-phosphate acyltransferase [Cohnella sp. OV330]|uniref:glycerol-3-phosphate acyltransferase n=1 Tax=Cohnella sp. OV330 TaxID=1855288 RepID=UPI0008E7B124|nr:glycerol-3-phosphate acyltransferase [Cohnella sp. OV330]SFB54043.1 acyl-phosphate glycerol 3-phosphate acyltransferase [Cohnella sp. OV330]